MMNYSLNFDCSDTNPIQKQLNDLYDYNDDEITKVFHRLRINLFYLLLNKYVKKNETVGSKSALDIGCNAGFYSKLISDSGFEHVLGIDINEPLIKKANLTFSFKTERETLSYKVLNAENLDLSLKFDFILCTEVIEHTQNPYKVIDNIKSILNKNGIAIITLPNFISFPYLLTYFFYKIKRRDFSAELKDHMNYPFYKTIKILKDKKFKIIKTTGTNLILCDLFIKKFHKSPSFGFINKLNFIVSRWFPFKYFTQFFFVVIKKEI